MTNFFFQWEIISHFSTLCIYTTVCHCIACHFFVAKKSVKLTFLLKNSNFTLNWFDEKKSFRGSKILVFFKKELSLQKKKNIPFSCRFKNVRVSIYKISSHPISQKEKKIGMTFFLKVNHLPWLVWLPSVSYPTTMLHLALLRYRIHQILMQYLGKH